MRQAVVIIHGVGEQRPLDTLRKFAKNVVGGKVRNKPDKMSALLELRRLQLSSTRRQPLTDFYEYYWAHHMRDTKLRMLISWFRTLLFRHPLNISLRLKPIYWIGWGTIGIVLGTIIFSLICIILFGHWITGLFILIIMIAAILFIDYNIIRIGYGIVDDAARYLNPAPDNIAQRNTIRKEGIELLDTLHKSKNIAE